jgi:hypothetical protein
MKYNGSVPAAVDDYVAEHYWTYLQRTPDWTGLVFWLERIAIHGMGLNAAGLGVSNEFAAQVGVICTPRVEVL